MQYVGIMPTYEYKQAQLDKHTQQTYTTDLTHFPH